MQRVAIVIASLKRGGGAERVAALIASGLPNADTQVQVLTFYDEKETYPFTGKMTCLHESPTESRSKKVAIRAKRIAAFCKEHKIDTVISFMEEANFPVLLSKYFGNKAKMVVSVRQDPAVYGSTYKRLIRWLYPKADHVVAVSKQMQHDLERIFFLKNVTTIYNPVDADATRSALAESLPKDYADLFKDKFTFITVGRLSFQKGHWFLLRVFAEVYYSNPTAQLVILGEGDLKEPLKELVDDFQIHDAVHWLGNQRNVYPFLSHSDVFVFPSLWEGFPNTMIEALAAGLPVISTDCPTGPREVLAPQEDVTKTLSYPYEAEYGILIENFPRLSVDEVTGPLLREELQLRDVMERFITDKSLLTRYAHGRDRVKELSLPVIADAWRSLL